MKKFTENLTFLLSDILELSGNALGKEMGVNQALVSRYRKGTTKPPVDFVIELCNKYGISANWLLLDVLPVKLSDLTETDCDDWQLRKIEQKKELAQDFDKIINCINEIKEKNSL